MKQLLMLLLIGILLVNCSGPDQASSEIVLKGQVYKRNSSFLLLAKSSEDMRYQGVEIEISNDGSFEYVMEKPEYIEEYELVFKEEYENGAWRPILFYPDSEVISFELYPMDESESNKVTGSETTTKLQNYRQLLSDEFRAKFIRYEDQLDSIRLKNPESPEVMLIEEEIKGLQSSVQDWQMAYFKQHMDLMSYNEFIDLTRYVQEMDIPQEKLDDLYQLFSQKFPDHPYTTRITNALYKAVIGGQFVDFSAPDSTGINYSVSDLMQNNKLTLLDLWAPWCGPCIKKSKEIQQVYNELNPMGFAVIGVVGGIKSEDEYFTSIRRHNYPWTVLMERPGENQIWMKYNIGSGGGSQFLIDEKGEILAINPSLQEIKQIIEKS